MLVTDINKKQLAVSVAIPLLVGGLAAAINFSGFRDFQSLNQPALTPPPWVFSVVWTILYVLMGVSFYLILNSDKKNKTLAYSFYFAGGDIFGVTVRYFKLHRQFLYCGMVL